MSISQMRIADKICCPDVFLSMAIQSKCPAESENPLTIAKIQAITCLQSVTTSTTYPPKPDNFLQEASETAA